MRIHHLEIKNLNGKFNHKIDFHDDVNVLTGVNGSGKTTILKMIWYMISGNLERLAPEIEFDSATLVTSKFTLKVNRSKKSRRSSGAFRFDLILEESESMRPKELGIANSDNIFTRENLKSQDINEMNTEVAILSQSAFFPTFRRIEGGFGRSRTISPEFLGYNSINREFDQLRESVGDLSKRLSVFDHTFVTSISLDDIVNSLTAKYAISSQDIDSQIKFSHERIRKVMSSSGISDNRKLDEIKRLIDSEVSFRNQQLRSFDALSKAARVVFRHKRVKLSNFMIIGESSDPPIPVDHLSAGEKQMISFLFYNAFLEDSIIFIDEPELSLHNDWQRILFTALMSQGTNNQFFVATHSPMIYSKFSDKEIILREGNGS